MTSPPAAEARALDAPRPVAERVALLDVLRGFALYGVLLANTDVWYSGWGFLPNRQAMLQGSIANPIAMFLITLFVDNKAMTLLSFLFGLGFAMQLSRAEARGQRATPMYLRRLGVMLLMGICHAWLLWWGDILQTYAVVGAMLLVFRGRRDRTLVIWALVFCFVPSMLAMHPKVRELIEWLTPGTKDFAAFKAQVLAALMGNDYPQLVKMQMMRAIRFNIAVAPSSIFWTLGRFLIGYYVGRKGYLHDAPKHTALFRKTVRWCTGPALVFSSVGTVRRWLAMRGTHPPTWVEALLTIPQEIGTLAMVATAVAGIALLMERPAWSKRLMLLAPVGQMPLTNYISQSVICTFLFYGWGLGLMGKVGTALCIPLTLALYAVQCALSHGWMGRFRLGPLEWVWRSLSYARLQPLRR